MATQAEAGRGLSLKEARDGLLLVASIAVVVGALAIGIQWVVSSAVAPLYAELRVIDNRLDGIETKLDKHSGILAELRERLTRIETILLERDKEAP
ncbi:MAG: hypothetical protein OXP66_14325 [Candidatus Tectomicrobia bacterium]|nr:hypothetical protein [Candidatus Tectomicrobia bacterium]